MSLTGTSTLGRALRFALGTLFVALLLLAYPDSRAHIVPPEELAEQTESYRRMAFLLALNPVPWEAVARDADVIARALRDVDATVSLRYVEGLNGLIDTMQPTGEDAPAARDRKAAARELFVQSTHAMARVFRFQIEAAGASLATHSTAARHLEDARGTWQAFEHEIRHTDPTGYQRLGESWLELNMALGHPGVLGVGRTEADAEMFARNAARLVAYVDASFAGEIVTPRRGFAALPAHSGTFEAGAPVPQKLPPGSDINKQLPRPRQILNMATRGVDESETVLIALGDMAFDSHVIFGDPARSLGLSCNTCHNKGVTNPKFFIPGLSPRAGALDVSNSFFAAHANNGHYDPLDIPDLRGIRFTAPYGRNGRFDSLREFTRNVIVNEFNGVEPDPLLLDGMVAYMLEIDFLPNPYLLPDGRLAETAPAAARRGERLFNQPFEQMGGRACSSCHIPSDNFIDRKRHDLGTVRGAEEHSRDTALDTPTLLSVLYSAPYFHDGSAPSLAAVNRWFNDNYRLGLTDEQIADLTAYVETVGYGSEAYEDTIHTLESEMEEFYFFLSTYEFLRDRGKPALVDVTLATIAYEIRAHKWDVQDPAHLPVLDRLADLMDAALLANRQGDALDVQARVDEYRQIYEANREQLR